MSSPQLAPQTLGEIITMAVAPVFLISSLIAYLGVLSARSTRIVDNLLVLQASDAELISLQKQRMRCIALAFREVAIAAALVCGVVICLFLNVSQRMDLTLAVSILFISAMVLVVHSLITFHQELQLAIRSARLKFPGSF
ncbi:MAG: DUF2721 domain-containing protein [Synechococcus sp. H1_metabat_bins_2.tsv.006]|jgi:flagellar biosynthesis protein FliQ|nr:DUF2721 domain-containing protein [Synechococcus sp. H1_metabat_bins_2.tsv.006]